MKTVLLLGAAVIAGVVRYPIEGPIVVNDAEADTLVENNRAEIVQDVEVDADDGSDTDLGGLTVDQLKEVADKEAVDLTGITLKAEIIAAINAKRSPQA